MDQIHVRKLLLTEYESYLQILDTKGIGFSPPYTDKEMAALPIPDLKRLVQQVKDLGRTPTGNG
ncbi:TPA_asm: hypothetical protein [ssRNA phage Esthiorhiza.2_37]|uniref:Uncharacterized protein n=2 Tax=Fiersviridae TaxID=2842319 RepID=A0A8S5L388_9VIRU|nr:hypothetical protein QIL47_gp2 [ssRNA phage Esthiorhiza.2_37]QDH87126.1 MAG: hypothetical protein H2RhizoLitter49668_000006 [Leviviridae sp.]DAD51884.1 TPA_asm: hypothetical protein [ssRNA phage Esthiorhiza.2_37]